MSTHAITRHFARFRTGTPSPVGVLGNGHRAGTEYMLFIAAHKGSAGYEIGGERWWPGISADRLFQNLSGELEILHTGNPAARCLPMLAAIARGEQAEMVLPYFPESQLIVRLRC